MAGDFPFKVRFSAVDKMSAAIDRVAGKFPKLTTNVTRASNAFAILQARTEGVRGKLDKVAGGFKNVGSKLTTAITLPVAAGLGLSIKAFADYETALTGVGKTTGLQGDELKRFGEKISALSKKIPVSSNELLGLGQTAAQLGVTGSDNILKFSEVLAKLSRASDVTGEEGAAQLARFIKVTGGSITEVDRFASTLVALGNTSAATEAEILSFASRMGAATALFNVTGTQALGLSTTLKSIGIEAEAGSSSVQRALGAMNESINKGGKEMALLSKLTGISTTDLKKRFKTDAMGVLREFANGLSNVEKKGGDVSTVMSKFGLTGVRDIQVIGALTKNVALLDEKLAQSADAFKKNTALEEEFATASKTLANKFQLLKNNMTALAVKIGAVLAPVVTQIIDKLISFATWMQTLNPTILKWGLILAGVLAVIGPLLVAIGFMVGLIPQLIVGFNFLVAAAIFLGKGFAIIVPVLKLIGAGIAFLLSPIGLVVAAIVGLINLFLRFDKIKAGFQKGMFEGVKTFFGFGSEGGNPMGEAAGASGVIKQESQEKKARDAKARVGVEFTNLPQGAKTKVDGDMVDTMSFKTGFMNGAL